MAKYTTELRSIIENGDKVFDFDYPIFDEKYRGVLEQKIIDTYYFREIGLETVGQFKHFLKSRMNNIMPYYNQLYQSEKDFEKMDPYINKDLTTTDTRTTKQDSSGSSKTDSISKGSNKNTDIFSDTPQSRLEGKDYATNLTENEGESSDTTSGESTSTGTITSTDEYISTLKGFDGMKYASEVLMDLRKSFINVDQQIIDELSDLFMNIY